MTHRRQDLEARRAALKRGDPALLATLLEPATQAEVASWEAEQRATRIVWTPLDPSDLKSSGSATLTKQADFSVLSEGTRPAQETTTITARTDLRGITGVRLEVLPDDRLPSHGPGRNENGNLHLTEFRLSAAPLTAPAESRPVAVAPRAVAPTSSTRPAGGSRRRSTAILRPPGASTPRSPSRTRRRLS